MIDQRVAAARGSSGLTTWRLVPGQAGAGDQQLRCSRGAQGAPGSELKRRAKVMVGPSDLAEALVCLAAQAGGGPAGKLHWTRQAMRSTWWHVLMRCQGLGGCLMT